jgi:PAS domain S-box-containing protein
MLEQEKNPTMNEGAPRHIAVPLGENSLRLLDTLNIGFLHLDMDFVILEVNEKVLEWYGGNREELVGHHSREFFTPEEFNRLTAIEAPFLEHRIWHYQYEFSLHNKGGDSVPFLLSSSVDLDADGVPVATNVLLTEIGQQKRMQRELADANEALARSREALENEKRTLEAILFGIGDCVTVFDPAGRILLSNPLGRQVYGNRQEPLLGSETEASEIFRFEIDGVERFFTGRVQAIDDSQGRVNARAEILTEVTDQIRFEERENEIQRMKRRIERLEMGAEIIGPSPAMQRVFDRVLRCAEVDSSVLLLGETGVGKELVARAIHARSKRRDRPFVPVNCGSIPESLLESELFGHEKGAFTGAVASRIGLFREAEGGTLFLDEVGDLDPAFQVKLLRALQEREVRPLGGNRAYPVDVRIVSATNRDLAGMVARGSFRSDLYFRIAVIPVVIPPLRERREDILPLADNFLNKHAGRAAAAGRRLDPDARRLLLEYPWPGNIRELANAIEYAVAMSRRAVLQPADFPLLQAAQRAVPKSPVASTETGRFPQPVLDGLPPTYLKPWEVEERETILETLTRCKGNRGRAARKLRMSRTTLWRKIRRYDL